MKHWATQYIGLSYVEVGRCWGFVQLVCRDRLGIEMPVVSTGTDADQAATIRRAAAMYGWQHASAWPAFADDIAVMMQFGERHVGYVVEAGGTQGLLHAEGSMLKGGSVRFDTWRDLRERGYHSFEFWRRNASASIDQPQ